MTTIDDMIDDDGDDGKAIQWPQIFLFFLIFQQLNKSTIIQLLKVISICFRDWWKHIYSYIFH